MCLTVAMISTFEILNKKIINTEDFGVKGKSPLVQVAMAEVIYLQIVDSWDMNS